MRSDSTVTTPAFADHAEARNETNDTLSGAPERAPMSTVTATCNATVEALAREAMKSYSRAVRHVTRRGFGDIAKDAVQEALLLLVRRAADPAFVPPVVMHAWVYRWSVCSAFVLRRRGGRLDHVAFDDEVEAYARAGAELAERDAAFAPDHGLRAEAEERARDDWGDRIECARAELSPLDRETFDAEVARLDRGESAPPRHRKRLERARPRAQRVFSGYGLTNSAVPDNVSTRYSPRRRR